MIPVPDIRYMPVLFIPALWFVILALVFLVCDKRRLMAGCFGLAILLLFLGTVNLMWLSLKEM